MFNWGLDSGRWLTLKPQRWWGKWQSQTHGSCLWSCRMPTEPWLHGAWATLFTCRTCWLLMRVLTNRQMLLPHEQGEGDRTLKPEMAKLGWNPCGPTPHLGLCTRALSCRCGSWWNCGGNALLRVWCSRPFILETSWNGDLFAALLVGPLGDNCRWCFYLSVTCVSIRFDRHL